MICIPGNQRIPDRFAGAVYVNPLKENCTQLLKQYLEKGFQAVKLNPLRRPPLWRTMYVLILSWRWQSTIRFCLYSLRTSTIPFLEYCASRRALSQCQGDDDSYGTRTRCVYRRKPEMARRYANLSGNERYADAYKNQRGIRECRCRSYPVRH